MKAVYWYYRGPSPKQEHTETRPIQRRLHLELLGSVKTFVLFGPQSSLEAVSPTPQSSKPKPLAIDSRSPKSQNRNPDTGKGLLGS